MHAECDDQPCELSGDLGHNFFTDLGHRFYDGSGAVTGLGASMAFVRTALIIMALLLGWTALRHEGLAHGPAEPTATVTETAAPGR